MSGENAIRQFSNENLGVNIRVVDRDGEPWFVAKDVAASLGYVRTADAIREHCKGVGEMETPSSGGKQMMKIIPESDVYRLILRSKLPQAEAFQDWVVGEVLPSIRKHGAYLTDATLDRVARDPESIMALAEALVAERGRLKVAEECIDLIKPKAPLGEISKVNGRPKNKMVRAYPRSDRVTIEIPTEYRHLFNYLHMTNQNMVLSTEE